MMRNSVGPSSSEFLISPPYWPEGPLLQTERKANLKAGGVGGWRGSSLKVKFGSAMDTLGAGGAGEAPAPPAFGVV